MLCICRKERQVRLPNGKIRMFVVGETYDFEKCPKYFEMMEKNNNYVINFDTAKEEELLSADYKLKELKDYIFDKYGIKAGNRKLEKTVELLLDSRYREISCPNPK